MKKKSKHRFLKAAVGSIAVGTVVSAVPETLYRMILTRTGRTKADGIAQKLSAAKDKRSFDVVTDETSADVFVKADEWYDTPGIKRREIIRNVYGDPCSAFVFDGNGAKKWAIVCHGYSSTPQSVDYVAEFYYKQGYNVLMPEMRGHGGSVQEEMSFGYLDSVDVCAWVNKLVVEDEDCEILLHGLSMGAATVLMASGSDLPANVKCVVSDCAFTRGDRQFKDVMGTGAVKALYPLVDAVSLALKAHTGHSLREVDTLTAVERANIPTLFIHGEKDTVVPPRRAQELYDACKAEKEILIVPDAGHYEAGRVNYDLYFSTVKEFTERFIK